MTRIASGVVDVLTEKEVSFDSIAVAVAEGEGAGDISKRVVAKRVVAGLVGDDFDFAAGTFEQIVLDDGGGVVARGIAGANANGLKPFPLPIGRSAEIVVVDLVEVVGSVVASADDDGDTGVRLVRKSSCCRLGCFLRTVRPRSSGIDVSGVVVVDR